MTVKTSSVHNPGLRPLHIMAMPAQQLLQSTNHCFVLIFVGPGILRFWAHVCSSYWQFLRFRPRNRQQSALFFIHGPTCGSGPWLSGVKHFYYFWKNGTRAKLRCHATNWNSRERKTGFHICLHIFRAVAVISFANFFPFLCSLSARRGVSQLIAMAQRQIMPWTILF